MNRVLVGLVLGAALLAPRLARADQVTMQLDPFHTHMFFPDDKAAKLVFNNGTFSFVPPVAGAPDFIVSSPTSTAIGSTGTINGTFQIYNVSPDGNLGQVKVLPGSTPNPAVFTLTDPSGGVLTANLDFQDIHTAYNAGEPSGGIGSGIDVNLTNVVYTQGSSFDADFAKLQQYSQEGSGGNLKAVFSFTTTSPVTVGDLANAQNMPINFILELVSVDPVAPAPASWAMLFTGSLLVGSFGAYRRRRTIALT